MDNARYATITSNWWIAALSVSGFKSINREQTIQIKPLTVLAGANSSGKSSIIQTLLLLKQTLEAPYDPGPPRLDGANVNFTEASQLFFRNKKHQRKSFRISIVLYDTQVFRLTFVRGGKEKITLSEFENQQGNSILTLRPNMPNEEIKKGLSNLISATTSWDSDDTTKFFSEYDLEVQRNRCFLEIHSSHRFISAQHPPLQELLQSMIHILGLWGNPLHTYPVAAVGKDFVGRFHDYTASVIADWQDKQDDKIQQLGQDLERLDLTSKIEAKRIGYTNIELRVGRTRYSSDVKDLVNIADVGSGVSQSLPVLVSLLTAEPGQIVYLEEPEIHLHPRAQDAMAGILADAARRGVIVIAETHSSLLLRGIQTLVAQGELSPDLVKLHWFQRNDEGETKVTSASLDEAGRYGDWPEDFDEVILESENHYIGAAEAKLVRMNRAKKKA